MPGGSCHTEPFRRYDEVGVGPLVWASVLEPSQDSLVSSPPRPSLRPTPGLKITSARVRSTGKAHLGPSGAPAIAKQNDIL